MNCTQVRRKLGSFLDHEVTAKQQDLIENHLSICADCREEKRQLERLSSLIRSVPEVIPDERAEHAFWENVKKERQPGLMEKLRAFFGRWDVMPLRYSAAAMILFGLATGMLADAVYTTSTMPDDHLRPAYGEYFALDRMASIPEGSVTGVYLSMSDAGQNGEMQ